MFNNAAPDNADQIHTIAAIVVVQRRPLARRAQSAALLLAGEIRCGMRIRTPPASERFHLGKHNRTINRIIRDHIYFIMAQPDITLADQVADGMEVV